MGCIPHEPPKPFYDIERLNIQAVTDWLDGKISYKELYRKIKVG